MQTNPRPGLKVVRSFYTLHGILDGSNERGTIYTSGFHTSTNRTTCYVVEKESRLFETSIINKWLKSCEIDHICDQDHTSIKSDDDFFTYFIDISNLRLVKRPLSITPFVALSYVRGNSRVFEANSPNIGLLRRPWKNTSNLSSINRLFRREVKPT